MEVSKIIRPVIEIKQEGTLIITEQFLNQIKYICSEISAVEWSGNVFFSIEGDFKKVKELKIIPYYIHVMHKGDTNSTEFDDDGSLGELFKLMPELDPFEDTVYRYGKIHSHNTMSVFHSPTDHQDLQDQSGAYEYYLSVIVNNFMDIEAKISFVAEIPEQPVIPIKFASMAWELPKKEVLGIIDLNVEVETTIISVSETLKDRLDVVVEEARVSKHKEYGGVYGFQNYPGRFPTSHQLNVLNEYEEEDDYNNGLDVVSYRTTQGMKDILEFINGYFKSTHKLPKAFEIIDGLPAHAMERLEGKLLVWFEKLTIWRQQNIIIMITDKPIAEAGTNSEQLYQAIYEYALVKSEE